jgi:flagellar motor switch protein FliN
MPELVPAILSDVLAACQAGASEAAAALGRAFDVSLAVSVGESSPMTPEQIPEDLAGAGLGVLFQAGGRAAVFLLPESTQLLPDWYAHPDKTGQSKLTTLAQELGMILLPETISLSEFKASRVENLAEALRRSKLASEAVAISFSLTAEDGRQGTARLIWPIGEASLLPDPPAPQTEPAAAPTASAKPPASTVAAPSFPKKIMSRMFSDYTKSLLRIQVPVVVKLADKKQQLGRVLELGPGMIIQFDKSCDEMLDLEVGNRNIAQGEVVKVGDKFGLRVTNIVLPGERFLSVGKAACTHRSPADGKL